MAFSGGLFGAYRIGVQLNLASNIPQQSAYINKDLMAMQAQMRELQATALQTRRALLLASTPAQKAALNDSLRLQRAQIAGQRAQLLLTQNQAVKERELFNQRRAQLSELDAQRASVGSQVSGLATVGAVGVGVLSGAAVISGIEGAAKLQLAMQTVAEATGATTEQMRKLSDMVLQVSGITAQSADTIAQEMATAARAGLNSFGRLQQSFPQIARFADVQYFAAQASGRDASVTDLVSVATQFAHYFQAYSGSKLANMLNDLNKLMFTQPEDINRLLTQGRYFIPMATRLGMSEPEIMKILAAMGQTGFLRGKGGTGLANTLLGAINAATVTEHLQGARTNALRELGLMNAQGKTAYIGPHGEFDSQLLWSGLIAAGARLQPVKFIADIQNAFGKQAAQLISVLTGPQVQKQIHFISDAFSRMGTVEQMFDDFFNNFLPQWQKLLTNVRILFTSIFMTQLPTATQIVRSLGDSIGRLGQFFRDHPRAALATAIGTLSALGGAFAVVSAQAILWLNRLSIEIARLGVTTRNATLLGGIPKSGVGAAESEGGAMAEGGFLGWIATRMGIAGLLRGVGVAASSVLRIGARLFPIVAWITAIYEALNLLANLPDLVVELHNWWEKNYPQIGYTIGLFFGNMLIDLKNGFEWLGKLISSVLSNLFSPNSVLTLIGDMYSLNPNAYMSDYNRIMRDAIKRVGVVNGPGQSFGHYFAKGFFAPIVKDAGHHVAPATNHFHGNIIIHPPAGTSGKQILSMVLDEFGKQSRSATRVHGNTPNVPGFSAHEVMALG